MDISPFLEIVHGIRHELLLVCVSFIALGAVDDLGFDAAYLWMRLRGKLSGARAVPAPAHNAAKLAIFVPAWQEAGVIGPTVHRMQDRWGDDTYTIFIGCYRNDPDTIAASMQGVDFPARVRIVINTAYGPTTKGDCLNRLWLAMQEEEAASGIRYSGVVLHDAEDWVHSQELTVFRHYLPHHAMIQIPVIPFIPRTDHWVAGHYADEFIESHCKTLRARHVMGGSLPAAGVGCAFDRDMLHFIAQHRGGHPFSCDSLVEDYELGLLIHELGGRPVLAYHRDIDGALIATRAFFPMSIGQSVRQKTRWLTGIALAGWDRMGWRGGAVEYWMRLHDRRSVLAAFILAMGYIVIALTVLLWIGARFVPVDGFNIATDPDLMRMTAACGLILLWRLAVRALFVGRHYGWKQAGLAILRQPIANSIAIMAATRAVIQYARHCRGHALAWDKTDHEAAEHNAMRAHSDMGR